MGYVLSRVYIRLRVCFRVGIKAGFVIMESIRLRFKLVFRSGIEFMLGSCIAMLFGIRVFIKWEVSVRVRLALG